MTELDHDIAATEHRLLMAKKGVNPWEIPTLEKWLVSLRSEREHVNAVIASTVKPYRPPRARFKILAKWEPDFVFVPTLIDESFYECQARVNRERSLCLD